MCRWATQTQRWINTCAPWRLSRRKCKLILIFNELESRQSSRVRLSKMRGRGKRAEKIREFRSLLIYDLWVFAWHCDVFSAPLSSSPSLSRSLVMCQHSVRAYVCKRKTRFAAISHSLNLFSWVREKVRSRSLIQFTADGKIMAPGVHYLRHIPLGLILHKNNFHLNLSIN